MSVNPVALEALSHFSEDWLLIGGTCVVAITIGIILLWLGIILLWLFPPKNEDCGCCDGLRPKKVVITK